MAALRPVSSRRLPWSKVCLVRQPAIMIARPFPIKYFHEWRRAPSRRRVLTECAHTPCKALLCRVFSPASGVRGGRRESRRASAARACAKRRRAMQGSTGRRRARDSRWLLPCLPLGVKFRGLLCRGSSLALDSCLSFPCRHQWHRCTSSIPEAKPPWTVIVDLVAAPEPTESLTPRSAPSAQDGAPMREPALTPRLASPTT